MFTAFKIIDTDKYKTEETEILYVMVKGIEARADFPLFPGLHRRNTYFVVIFILISSNSTKQSEVLGSYSVVRNNSVKYFIL